MNEVKRTTFKDRLCAAFLAFKSGEPVGAIHFGVEIKRCDKCELKREKQAPDCARCRTRACRMRDWPVNEMWVKANGCPQFTPAKENEEGNR